MVLLSLFLTTTSSSGQSFFDAYRYFWKSKLTASVKVEKKEQCKNNVYTFSVKNPNIKERIIKIDNLEMAIKAYKDQNQIDIEKSNTIFILIFLDQRTELERTYLWTRTEKFYFMDVIGQNKDNSQAEQVRVVSELKTMDNKKKDFIIKDDTLQTLLENKKLKAMSMLAQKNIIAGGETCIGIICEQIEKIYRFTSIDLPPFEFIKVNKL